MRALHPDPWHPAGPQGLHRPAVRLQTREPRAVPAPVLPETRKGEFTLMYHILTQYTDN